MKNIFSFILLLLCLTGWGQGNIPISSLPVADTLGGADFYPVIQNGHYKKVGVSVISTQLQHYLDSRWSVTGNAGTDTTNFLGTTGDVDLIFRRNDSLQGYLKATNLAFGYRAGEHCYGGNYNIFLGYESGFNDAAPHNSYNTAVGFQTLYQNTATGNTALGAYALDSNRTGLSNTAIGFEAAKNTTGGDENTVVGYHALFYSNGNVNNTSIGAESLSALATGDNNTAIGWGAGSGLFGGSGNVFVGSYAGSAGTNMSNRLFIDNHLRFGNDSSLQEMQSLITGTFGVDSSEQHLRINGQLQISDGTQASGYVLTSDATGNASWQAATALPSGTNFNVLFTNGSGNPAWSYQLYDNSGINSIDFFNRTLTDNGGTGVLYWNSKQLVDGSGNLCVNWQNRALFDNTLNLSLDWQGRKLSDSTGNLVIDYNSGIGTGIQLPNGAVNGYVLQSDASGNASWQPPASTGWGLGGNSGTNYLTNYVGTADGQMFVLQNLLDTAAINMGYFGSPGTGISLGANNIFFGTKDGHINFGKFSRSDTALHNYKYVGTGSIYNTGTFIDTTTGANGKPISMGIQTINGGTFAYMEAAGLNKGASIGVGTFGGLDSTVSFTGARSSFKALDTITLNGKAAIFQTTNGQDSIVANRVAITSPNTNLSGNLNVVGTIQNTTLAGGGNQLVYANNTGSYNATGIDPGSLLLSTDTTATIATQAYVQNYVNQANTGIYRGTFSQTITGASSVVVSIGATMPNNTYTISATPGNALSAMGYWINTKTTTTFTINFAGSLTGDIVFDWQLIQ